MEKDRYKKLFERSADAILIIRGGRFVDCNRATVKMLRYKSKEVLLNTHPSQLSPEFQPDGRASFEKANEMIEIAFQNGSHRFEWDHKKADGEIFPVEVLLTAVEENGEKTLHVVWRDITDRKQKEADLLRTNSIIESTPDLIVSVMPDSTVFYLNKAAKKAFNVDLEGPGAGIKDFHPPWALDIIINQGIPAAVANGLWEGETAALFHDGNEAPVSQVIMAHKNTSGKLLYLSTIMRDMSEHYQSRAEKLELQNRLHHAQKMEAIGTLAGGIAHDFNNILSGIFGYCQLAKNHINTPKKAADHIDEIVRGSQKAAELIQQILTFSRKSPHIKQPLRIYLIIKEALKLLRASLPSTITIRENINSREKVMADATKIHQVMMNLCTNAFQAMQETGGILTVSLDNIHVKEAEDDETLAIEPGDYIKIVVADTGPGIRPNDLEKIFEPYFTTKKTTKGTGLGLAVVHGIVEEHKGFIHVDTKQGRGSSFIIYLPTTRDDQTHREKAIASQSEPIRSGSGFHILLVDDETSILNSTGNLLQHQGYRVSPVSESKNALALFKKTPEIFDLVISDITMPGMTGDKLAEKILNIRKDLPIILCSGYSEKVSREALRDLGVRLFLQKPIPFKNLIRHIQLILHKKKT